MTFAIDPDYAFQKVATATTRRGPGGTSAEGGATFASTLMQTSDKQDTPAATATAKGPASGHQGPRPLSLLHVVSDEAIPAEGEQGASVDEATDDTELSLPQEPDGAIPAEAESADEDTSPNISDPDTSDVEVKTAEAKDAALPEQAEAAAPGEQANLTAQTATAEAESEAIVADAPAEASEQPTPKSKRAGEPDTDVTDKPAQDASSTDETSSPTNVTAAGAIAAQVADTRATTGKSGTQQSAETTPAVSTAEARAPDQTLQKPATSDRAEFTRIRKDADTDFTVADVSGSHDETQAPKASTATSPSADSALVAAGQSLAQTAAQPAQSPDAAPAMTATNGILTASPTETIKIIADTIASPDDRQDRITVQLDPPELGRVSIDFKFDANGLRHVTVTGENPEALRQLRLMHYELSQALERSGLSGHDMTFQQQSHSGQQQQPQTGSAPRGFTVASAADTSIATISAPVQAPRPTGTAGAGIDIRL